MAKYGNFYIIRPNIEEEAKNALVAFWLYLDPSNGALVFESRTGKNVVLYEIKISAKDFTTSLTLKLTTT